MLIACACGGVLEAIILAIVGTSVGFSWLATNAYNKKRCRCKK